VIAPFCGLRSKRSLKLDEPQIAEFTSYGDHGSKMPLQCKVIILRLKAHITRRRCCCRCCCCCGCCCCRCCCSCYWLGFCILFLDLRIWGFLYFLTSGFLYFGICGFLEFGFWIVGFLDSGILDCWISTAVCKFDCLVVVVGKLYLCTPRAFVIASLPSPLSNYHC
jgi:hypothetical protein